MPDFEIGYTVHRFNDVVSVGSIAVESDSLELVQCLAFSMVCDSLKRDQDEDEDEDWRHYIKNINVSQIEQISV